ncbi:hypothetical protein ABTF84_19650, partial [Acinetobacter baumannii]
LRGDLIDGNRFEFNLIRYVRRKERSKRKGKKVKETIWEGLELNMKIQSKSAELLNVWPNHLQSGPTPRGSRVTRAKSEGGRIRAEAETPCQERLS